MFLSILYFNCLIQFLNAIDYLLNPRGMVDYCDLYMVYNDGIRCVSMLVNLNIGTKTGIEMEIYVQKLFTLHDFVQA